MLDSVDRQHVVAVPAADAGWRGAQAGGAGGGGGLRHHGQAQGRGGAGGKQQETRAVNEYSKLHSATEKAPFRGSAVCTNLSQFKKN